MGIRQFSYDELMGQLNLFQGPAIMRAGWTYRAAGMEPVQVLIYDRPGVKPHEQIEEQHQRRLLVVQGVKPLTDIIIDHMWGY